MQTFGFMLVLASVAALVGLVIGLRFNVRLLVWLCLGAIAIGGGTSLVLPAGAGHPLASTIAAVVALQAGYFTAVVIQAMRVDEMPAGDVAEAAPPATIGAASPPPRG